MKEKFCLDRYCLFRLLIKLTYKVLSKPVPIFRIVLTRTWCLTQFGFMEVKPMTCKRFKQLIFLLEGKLYHLQVAWQKLLVSCEHILNNVALGNGQGPRLRFLNILFIGIYSMAMENICPHKHRH